VLVPPAVLAVLQAVADLDGGAGLSEALLDQGTETEDDSDEDRRYGGNQQAVLDGGRAPILSLAGQLLESVHGRHV
jgi:hypothetical protein